MHKSGHGHLFLPEFSSVAKAIAFQLTTLPPACHFGYARVHSKCVCYSIELLLMLCRVEKCNQLNATLVPTFYSIFYQAGTTSDETRRVVDIEEHVMMLYEGIPSIFNLAEEVEDSVGETIFFPYLLSHSLSLSLSHRGTKSRDVQPG